MNVHKRCQKNVANNCGINPKQMAEILSALGISSDKLGKPPCRKKKVILYFFVKILALYNNQGFESSLFSKLCSYYCSKNMNFFLKDFFLFIPNINYYFDDFMIWSHL